MLASDQGRGPLTPHGVPAYHSATEAAWPTPGDEPGPGDSHVWTTIQERFCVQDCFQRHSLSLGLENTAVSTTVWPAAARRAAPGIPCCTAAPSPTRAFVPCCRLLSRQRPRPPVCHAPAARQAARDCWPSPPVCFVVRHRLCFAPRGASRRCVAARPCPAHAAAHADFDQILLWAVAMRGVHLGVTRVSLVVSERQQSAQFYR